MKTRRYISLLIIAIAAIIGITQLTSCKKYPNDSGIQFKTVKNRLNGTWVWDQNITVKWTFNKDGSCTRTFGTSTSSYTYELQDHKNEILIKWTNSSQSKVVIIKGLTKNKLQCDLDSPTNINYTKQ